MQLLDDNLWMNFTAGKISAEEAIDKSKIPGAMVDRMQRAGIMVGKVDDALMAEAEERRPAAPGGGRHSRGGGRCGGRSARQSPPTATRGRRARKVSQ
jgi:hypothetical protein